MYNPIITPLHATPQPAFRVYQAATLTQKKQLQTTLKVDEKLIRYLYKANHTSLFEHAVISFHIAGISRALLAQITRHRMASYTVTSQHYQDYSSYDMVFENPLLEDYLEAAAAAYKSLLASGVPKEEARMVLPNASEVQMIWTINARSLVNFLELRLCRRNVFEMYTFADAILQHSVAWFPELFKHVGPECFTGVCKQGKMQCEDGYERVDV